MHVRDIYGNLSRSFSILNYFMLRFEVVAKRNIY